MISETCQPEVKDIIEMIRRYIAVNGDVCFIGGFASLKKGVTEKDIIEKPENTVNKEGNLIVAYGKRNDLRIFLDGLRKVVEDDRVTYGNDFVDIISNP
ncbi:MAG: hypothetical protein ACYSSI_09545 [Planctomycetota bacterium]|jgi:hypothetical protein